MSIPDDLRAVLRSYRGADWRCRGRVARPAIHDLASYTGPDVTPAQLAACFRPAANVRTVHRWIHEGRLPAHLHNDSREWRIWTEDAQRFVAARLSRHPAA